MAINMNTNEAGFSSINAIIETESCGDLIDTQKTISEFNNCNSALILLGRKYEVGAEDYALISAGYNDLEELHSVVEWLKVNNPELFYNLMSAMLSEADPDELDEALEEREFFEYVPDISVLFFKPWLEQRGFTDEQTFLAFTEKTTNAIDIFLQSFDFEVVGYRVEVLGEEEVVGGIYCEVDDDLAQGIMDKGYEILFNCADAISARQITSLMTGITELIDDTLAAFGLTPAEVQLDEPIQPPYTITT